MKPLLTLAARFGIVRLVVGVNLVLVVFSASLVSAGHSVPYYGVSGTPGNCWDQPDFSHSCWKQWHDANSSHAKNVGVTARLIVSCYTGSHCPSPLDHYVTARQNAQQEWDDASTHIGFSSSTGTTLYIHYLLPGDKTWDTTTMTQNGAVGLTYRCSDTQSGETCTKSMGVAYANVTHVRMYLDWDHLECDEPSDNCPDQPAPIAVRQNLIMHEMGHGFLLSHHDTPGVLMKSTPPPYTQIASPTDMGPLPQSSSGEACPNGDFNFKGVNCIFRWTTQ